MPKYSASGREIVRADDPDHPLCPATQTIVDGEQWAIEQAGEGDVFRVVRLRPTEIMGDLPRRAAQTPGLPTSDRSAQQRFEGHGGELLRDFPAPRELMNHRGRLRPEERGSDEVFGAKQVEPLGGKTGLDHRARVDDEQSSAAVAGPTYRADDVRHRLTGHRLPPGRRQRPSGGGQQRLQVGFLDQMLSADPLRPQPPGADPASDGFRVAARSTGSFGHCQHGRRILQHRCPRSDAQVPK